MHSFNPKCAGIAYHKSKNHSFKVFVFKHFLIFLSSETSLIFLSPSSLHLLIVLKHFQPWTTSAIVQFYHVLIFSILPNPVHISNHMDEWLVCFMGFEEVNHFQFLGKGWSYWQSVGFCHLVQFGLLLFQRGVIELFFLSLTFVVLDVLVEALLTLNDSLLLTASQLLWFVNHLHCIRLRSPLVNFVEKVLDIILQRVMKRHIKADHLKVELEISNQVLKVMVLVFLDIVFNIGKFGKFAIDELEVKTAKALNLIVLEERDAFGMGFKFLNEFEPLENFLLVGDFDHAWYFLSMPLLLCYLSISL